MEALKIVELAKLDTLLSETEQHSNSSNTRKFDFLKNKRLVISNSDGYEIVLFENIRTIRSDSNYTIISLQSGSDVVASKTMKFFERQLDQTFLRVHKSYIINLLHVSKFNKRDCKIVLDDNTTIPVARRKKQLVESYFIVE